ncbi:MAG TPA: hypothetical protein VER33_03270 [Polyangiaceae bacterium]|nr:hypothetical protein [Polyangiaceae bacterium]
MENKYEAALRISERVTWNLNDVLPEDAKLDFGQPFLPEALVGARGLEFLSDPERRTLNQIRAHGYLCAFGLIEEFILPFVLERLQARVDGEMSETRALLAFAGEEAKHIELFRRFRRVFERGFAHRCEVIGPASAIREHVLGHSQLGVGLLVLHIEWLTQHHYLAMVRNEGGLEPSFRKLLHEHWVEECQHARIDGWIVEAVAAAASEEERARAFADYVKLLSFLDQGLSQQVDLDLDAFERAARPLRAEERVQFRAAQWQSQRRTFLGLGVAHPRLRAAAENVHAASGGVLNELGRMYA